MQLYTERARRLFKINAIIALNNDTNSDDVGLHRQQVEEGEELDCEDSVNLCGRQHQHSQREQHFGVTLQMPNLTERDG